MKGWNEVGQRRKEEKEIYKKRNEWESRRKEKMEVERIKEMRINEKVMKKGRRNKIG